MAHDIISAKKYSWTPIVTKYLRWHKTCEKDVVGIITFDRLVLTFLTNHIFSYITMPYPSLWGDIQCEQSNSSNNKNCLKFHYQKVQSWKNGKLSWRFQTLILRPGDTVQNLESPGLSGRVDSTVYVQGCQ